jgi:hypothetical protein
MLVDSSSIDILRYLDRFQHSEVRTADDILGPSFDPPKPRMAGSAEERAQHLSVKMSPWLADAIEIISVQRGRLSNATEAGQQAFGLLDDAEMLAALFAGSDPRKRPQLNIMTDGRPSFATSTNDFYLHVMVDKPKRLTWYATVGGHEYFHDDVPFDGRRLPQELRELVSA